MRRTRTIKRAAIAIAAIGLAATGGLYLAASGVPERYRPVWLGPAERQAAAKRLIDKHVLSFHNAVQDVRPFTWTATQEELNRYLASMDEIASLAPDRRPGEVERSMRRAGFADPAVALEDGVVVLMVRLRRYNKIISAELSLQSLSDHKLAVRLQAVYLGYLPVPRSQLRAVLKRLQAELAGAADREKRQVGRASFAGVVSERITELLAVVLGAVDRDPIDTEILWPFGKKYVRIERVEIVPGRLTLYVVPTRRKTPH